MARSRRRGVEYLFHGTPKWFTQGHQHAPPPPASHASGSAGYHADLSIPHYQPATPTVAPPPGEGARGPAGSYAGAAAAYQHARAALPPAVRRTQAPPAPTAVPLERLLMPGGHEMTPRQLAVAAHALGVVPREVSSTVNSAAHDLGKGVKLAVQLPKTRPAVAFGHKTLGTPTLAELLRQAKRTVPVAQGQQPQNPAKAVMTANGKRRAPALQVNKRGELTTPRERKALKGYVTARRRYQRGLIPDTSGLSPAERRILPYAVRAHREHPDIPVSVLMAQIKQESGFNPLAESSAGAFGVSQFIPSTAASYGVRRGNSPSAIQSQVSGQAKLLHDSNFAADPQGALSSYSGGYAASAYNNPILEDARANYAQLDRPVNPNPQAAKGLEGAIAKLHQLGVRTPAQAAEAFGVPLVSPEKLATVPGKGVYVFPFPENKGWVWSRTDMGTDFAYTHEGAPIRALGSGTIIAPTPGEAHWEGGNGLVLKLDHAKGLPSQYVFLYEGINQTVPNGTRVKAGQVIATGGITGSIEIGFSNSEGVPLAAGEYTEGMVTKYGEKMTAFLHMVEEGKKRIPVGLLQVDGTVVPESGGVASGTGSSPSAVVEGAAPVGGRKGKGAQMPAFSNSVPISELLQTLSLAPRVGGAGEGEEGVGTIARILGRKRL